MQLQGKTATSLLKPCEDAGDFDWICWSMHFCNHFTHVQKLCITNHRFNSATTGKLDKLQFENIHRFFLLHCFSCFRISQRFRFNHCWRGGVDSRLKPLVFESVSFKHLDSFFEQNVSHRVIITAFGLYATTS